MIPEPAGILDQLAVVVDQRVVNRDDAILAIAGGWVGLQPLQTMRIHALHVPGRLSQPAIKAGLVSRGGKFAIDATDGLVFGNEQAGQIFSKMAPGGFVWEEVAKLNQ